EFNQPLLVHKAEAHPGPLPRRWGLVEIAPPSVMLSALKPGRAETTILRIYETDGLSAPEVSIQFHAPILAASEVNLMEDTSARLNVSRDTLRCSLHPFEIKTFAVTLRSASK